ncbi:DUF4334 domain-containing protein [Microbulbifer bruguierae]|uniref:DUF4334 domain-containing protein n=1 Tax=Microbulbifer bruguierae TaxID=3029061 RepID=A0ABY8NF55_9GAMM|nr:DUF4334 domain-containing protein [Microbulbifer bruguierae]WGL17443.1 DUF4334 domain-containing protein [Microbulbifer bruguierae]
MDTVMETDDNYLLTEFQNLKQSAAADEQLFEFFDSLPAIPAQRMLGDWTGGILSQNHPVEKQLKTMAWHGKRFSSADDVNPIISLNDAGERVVNDVLGTASLREVVFRGVATATMIYDKSPVFDHFRKVTEDLVMGVMDQKGNQRPLVFFLTRLNA